MLDGSCKTIVGMRVIETDDLQQPLSHAFDDDGDVTYHRSQSHEGPDGRVVEEPD